VKIIKMAASKGSPYGQLVLGLALLHGEGGVEQDENAGNELLSLARIGLEELVGSALRSPTDVFALGWAYVHSYCSLERATELFAEAAEDGHAIAHVALANLDPDAPRAIGLLREAAGKGLAIAHCELGWLYFKGRGLEKRDEGKAAELFQQAADQGSAQAQASLGTMYLEGVGVSKDEAKAVELFTQAAEGGDTLGNTKLGGCYLDGKYGVGKDEARAVLLLRPRRTGRRLKPNVCWQRASKRAGGWRRTWRQRSPSIVKPQSRET
jgi:TPR repeat protein